MPEATIQGWFFIITKDQQHSYDPLSIHCEMQAMFGEPMHLLADTDQFNNNTLVTLKIHQPKHRFIVKNLHTACTVFVTGELIKKAKKNIIMVDKIYPQPQKGDIANF